MGIPTLIDPRMLSQVGAAPPLQEVIKPSGLPPLPVPTVPVPAPVVPTGMGMDAMPRPAAPPVQQAGNGFAQMLVKSIPMLLAGIAASKGGRPAMTGLLEGYTSSLERKRILDQRQHEFDVQQAATEDERQIRQQNYQAQQQERIGTYITNALNYLDKVDDPGTYKAAVQQLDDAGVKAYGLPPGFIANRLSGAFDTTKATAKAQRDAEGVVTRARARYGDQFDEVAAGGATMKGPDGKERPLTEWQAMAGDAQAMSPEGTPIAATPKTVENEATFISRGIKAKQKALGHPLDEAETNAEVASLRQQFAQAGHIIDPETARHNKAMEAAQAAQERRLAAAGQVPTGKAPTVDANVDPSLKAYLDGRLDVNSLSTRTSNANPVSERKRAIDALTAADPTFSTMRYTTRKAFTDPNSKTSLNVRSLNQSVSHAAELADLAEAMNNGDVQGMNRFVNWVKTSLGHPEVTNVQNAITAVAGESASTFKNSGATDSEIEKWHQAFNTAQSPAQIQGAIKTLAGLVGKRMAALQFEWQRSFGPESYWPILDPDARQALTRFGVDLTNLDPGNNTAQTGRQGSGPTGGPVGPAGPTGPAGPSGGTVRMTAPDGKSYDVPAASVAAARAKGWK